MERFKELVSKCKNSVTITVNDHRDSYVSIEEYFSIIDKRNVDPEVFLEMIRTDTLVDIQFYAHTAIGSCSVYHYDIDKAMDLAVEIIREIEKERN